MKTLIASLAMALLVSSTSIATTATAAVDTPAEETKATMQTAVFPSANATKLNVIVANENNRSASVRILNQDGQVLVTEHISKAHKTAKVRFDMSELPDGTYVVEISNGDNKEYKQVTLKTTAPTVAAYRSIAMN